MRNILITIAVAMSACALMADEAANTTTPTDMPTAQCKPCPRALQCDGSAWINVEAVTLAAANGDPIAQYAIAYITDNGVGDTAPDAAKANELYRTALPGLQKAAENGHPIACRALSRMYSEGKGVDKDDAKAAEFMQKCKENCKKAKEHCKSHHCSPNAQGKPDSTM